MSRKHQSPAIRRAAETLGILAESPLPLRLTDLAEDLGYHEHALLGVLGTLEELGWVERDADLGGFRVGRGLPKPGLEPVAFGKLADVTSPILKQLAERTGDSAFLGTLRGDRVTIEEYARGHNPLHISTKRGASLPLLASVAGSVFLAAMPRESAARFVRRATTPRLKDASAGDVELFIAHLEHVRLRGFGAGDEAYLKGVRSVAAPVRHEGRTIAALWVAGLSSDLTRDTAWATAADVVRSANSVSKEIEHAYRPSRSTDA